MKFFGKIIKHVRKNRQGKDPCKLCVTEALTTLNEKKKELYQEEETNSWTHVDIKQNAYLTTKRSIIKVLYITCNV